MSGLGHLLLDLGHAVAGSDLALNEETRQLRSRGGQIHIGVAPISDVGYVVVWYGVTETGSNEVSARRVTLTGQPAGADFRVNTYTSSEEQNPSVASDAEGNFVEVPLPKRGRTSAEVTLV